MLIDPPFPTNRYVMKAMTTFQKSYFRMAAYVLINRRSGSTRTGVDIGEPVLINEQFKNLRRHARHQALGRG